MQEQPQFKSGVWEVELNVRDFVSQNVTPYDGDSSFLSGPTEKTKRVWEHCLQALKEERGPSSCHEALRWVQGRREGSP